MRKSPRSGAILFGVSEVSDPAVAVVRQLVETFPQADIELVVGASRHGANGKISNLMHLASRARHAVIVLSDSDIKVDRAYLRQVVAALDEPGVGRHVPLSRNLGCWIWFASPPWRSTSLPAECAGRTQTGTGSALLRLDHCL